MMTTSETQKPKEKKGPVPEGFEIEEEKQPQIKQKKQKVSEGNDEAVFLFDAEVKSDAPRNVYRETVVSSISHTAKDWIWWHAENSEYVGREPITELPKGLLRPILKGYKYNIPYNEKNREKILSLKTARTNFYLKEGEQTIKVKDPAKEW